MHLTGSSLFKRCEVKLVYYQMNFHLCSQVIFLNKKFQLRKEIKKSVGSSLELLPDYGQMNGY